MSTKKAAAAVRARTVASKGGRAVKESGQRPYSSQEDSTPSDDPIDKIVRRALKPMKIPAKMGAVADDLYTTRAQRLSLSKLVDKLEQHEKDLKNYVIDNLSKDDATGSAGKVARVQINTVEEPVVENWDKFYATIKRTGAFELLNRAMNKKAVKERWENKKTVPGVGKFTVKKVSVTKV